MTQPHRIAIYWRDDPDSPRFADRKDQILARARELGDDSPVVYGVQGGNPASIHHALETMLKNGREGKFQAVLVLRLDRLGGRIGDVLGVLDRFESNGIRVLSLDDNLDTGGPHREGIRLLREALQRLDRDVRGEKISWGVRHAKASGRPVGRPATQVDPAAVHALRAAGMSYRRISSRLGISKSQVAILLKKFTSSAGNPSSD